MSRKSFLFALASGLLSVSAMAGAAQADKFSKTYNNPKVGSKKLDGCYSFPGSCNSQQQANAFCKMNGYAFASAFNVTNKFGAFQAKRLGDGGTCTASCTVMTRVVCIAEGHDYE